MNMRSTFLALITLVIASSAFVTAYRPEPKKLVDKLVVPAGFQTTVVVDSLPGLARHLAVNDNGDIYVKGRRMQENGINYALRDTDGDGRADSIVNFGTFRNEGAYSTEMRIHNGYLYTSSETFVYRYKLKPGELVPSAEPEIIVQDGGGPREHDGKPIAFDDQGYLYVPFGGPSDACQEKNRAPNSPGMKPCPLLDSHAGIWKFKADQLNQYRTTHGKRVATGLRSIVGMEWNPRDKSLYVVAHGRDNLNASWPQYYSDWDNAVLPAEAFYRLPEGADAGWPYYYYDQIRGKLMLGPEYGGDGTKVCTDPKIVKPTVAFPGHYAPNDVLFYRGNQFPERYRNGAFVAFHGSTIRAPYPQAGYYVGFIPFKDGKWQPMEVFADGFAGVDTIYNTMDAAHRPMGLAVGPDGSLYVSDSQKGRIWKISFKGNRQTFGETALAPMRRRALTRTNIKNPDPVKDNLDKSRPMTRGEELYTMYCRACHQRTGAGDGNRYPPIVRSEWVRGDSARLINVMLKGLQGPITVLGKEYNNVMPAFEFLNDEDLATLLTYIRRGFSNWSPIITPAHVATEREKLKP
jgi:glucose/arabinose dehydrogenase